MVQIDARDASEIFDIEGKLFEKITTSLDKRASPCKHYSANGIDFNSCCRSVFTEYVVKNGNCSAPGMHFYLFHKPRQSKIAIK